MTTATLLWPLTSRKGIIALSDITEGRFTERRLFDTDFPEKWSGRKKQGTDFSHFSRLRRQTEMLNIVSESELRGI